MRVVVLGGTGFIGRHLVRALAARGLAVSLYSRRPWGLLPAGVTEHLGAIDDFDRMDPLFRSAGGLVYLAWCGFPHGGGAPPEEAARPNVETARSVFDRAARAGMRRIVFISSGGTVYGEPLTLPVSEAHPTNPVSAYGTEKLAVENHLLLLARGRPAWAVVLRPSTVFGPGQRPGRGQGLITTAMDRLRRGDPVDVWGSGEEVRDYLYVDDLVRALVLALETESPPDVLNIGSETGYTVSEVLRRLARVTGVEPIVRRHPAPPGAVRKSVLNCARARESLGWRPQVPLDRGLEETWQWVRRGAPNEP
jgi:UDP-glucose 4-epimerase